MISQNVTVTNQTGIHARPASLFLDTAARFKSDITVAKNGKSGNAKSLLSLLSLGIKKDSEITITANGEDEKEAVTCLVTLVETKFGEQ
jgi:phosphocarrier protein HPr